MSGAENPERGRYRFFFLLLFLLVYIFMGEILGARRGIQLIDVLFSVVLILSAYSVSERKLFLYVALGLLLPTLVLTWFVSFLEIRGLILAALVFLILFFAFVAGTVLRHVMESRRVTPDTVSAALCAYLLLGLIWACLFTIVDQLVPGSFRGPAMSPGAEGGVFLHSGFPRAVYYSFTTLTTLGYGDITAVQQPAQSLSVLEAVLGQIYMAVLVARLVGLEIANRTGQGKE